MTKASPSVFVPAITCTNDYLTVGSPIPNTLARIVDYIDTSDATKEFGPGEVGEIQVKRPQVSSQV